MLVHLEYLREKMDLVCDRLNTQNGKLEEHGQDIAVLKDRVGEGRTAGRNWGAGAGAAGGFLGGLFAAFLQKLGGSE